MGEEGQPRRCPPAAAPRRAAIPMHADYYSLMIMFLLRMGTAAKCQVILARALRDAHGAVVYRPAFAVDEGANGADYTGGACEIVSPGYDGLHVEQLPLAGC